MFKTFNGMQVMQVDWKHFFTREGGGALSLVETETFKREGGSAVLDYPFCPIVCLTRGGGSYPKAPLCVVDIFLV